MSKVCRYTKKDTRHCEHSYEDWTCQHLSRARGEGGEGEGGWEAGSFRKKGPFIKEWEDGKKFKRCPSYEDFVEGEKQEYKTIGIIISRSIG